MSGTTGLAQIFAELQRARDVLVENAGFALKHQGETLLDESQERCPVKSGELRDSGYSTGPERLSSSVVVVEVGFKAEHAPEVHERQEAELDSGEPKWLEKAAVDRAAVLHREVHQEIRAAIRDGFS